MNDFVLKGEVSLETKPAEARYNKFIRQGENTPINVDINIDIKQLIKKFKSAVNSLEKESIDVKVDADTRDAERDIKKLSTKQSATLITGLDDTFVAFTGKFSPILSGFTITVRAIFDKIVTEFVKIGNVFRVTSENFLDGIDRFRDSSRASQFVQALKIDSPDLNVDNINKLESAISSVASNLPLKVKNLSEGVINLVRAGESLPAIINNLPEISIATIAAGESFELVSRLSVAAEQVFRNADLTTILNQMAFAANESQQSFEDLSYALKSLKGTDLASDTFTVMSMALADIGIQGETAGTAIRNFFDFIAKNSNEFAAFGVNLFDENNNLRDQQVVLLELLTLYKTLDDAQKAYVETLLGERGGAVIQALDRKTPNEIITQIQQVQATGNLLQRQAEVIMGGFEGIIQRFVALYDTFLTFDIGKPLSTVATEVVKGAISVIEMTRDKLGERLSNIVSFTTTNITTPDGNFNDEVNKSLGLIAEEISNTILQVATSISNLFVNILNDSEKVSKILNYIFGSFRLLTDSIGLIIDFFNRAIIFANNITEFIGNVIDQIKSLINSFKDAIGLSATTTIAIQNIIEIIKNFGEINRTIVINVLMTIYNLVKSIFSFTSSEGDGSFRGIRDTLASINTIFTIVLIQVRKLTEGVIDILNSSQKLQAVGRNLVLILAEIVIFLSKLPIVKLISTSIIEILNTVELINIALTDTTSRGLDVINGSLVDAKITLREYLDKHLPQLTAFINEVYRVLVDVVQQIIRFGSNLILVSKEVDLIGDALDVVKGFLDIIVAFGDLIISNMKLSYSLIKKTVTGIQNARIALESTSSEVDRNLQLATAIIKSLEFMLKMIKNSLDFIHAILKANKELIDSFRESGSIVEALSKSFKSFSQSIDRMVEGSEKLKNTWEAIKESIEKSLKFAEKFFGYDEETRARRDKALQPMRDRRKQLKLERTERSILFLKEEINRIETEGVNLFERIFGNSEQTLVRLREQIDTLERARNIQVYGTPDVPEVIPELIGDVIPNVTLPTLPSLEDFAKRGLESIENASQSVKNDINQMVDDMTITIGEPQDKPIILDSKESQQLSFGKGDTKMTLHKRDKAALAYILLNEAGFDPQAQANVFQSLINRVISPDHEGTLSDVIFARGQYSPIGDMSLNPNQLQTLTDAIKLTMEYRPSWDALDIERGINEVFENLTPSRLILAREFVEGRTDFKGYRTGFPEDPYDGFNTFHISPEWQSQNQLDEINRRNGLDSDNAFMRRLYEAFSDDLEVSQKIERNTSQSLDSNNFLMEGFSLEDLRNYQPMYGQTEYAPRPGGRLHNGLDLDRSSGFYDGIPVKSVIDGVVESVYELRDFPGQMGVRIAGQDASGQEIYTALNHLGDVMVKTGDRIVAGQKVAIGVGDHLDIKTRVSNRPAITTDFIEAMVSGGGNVRLIDGDSLRVSIIKNEAVAPITEAKSTPSDNSIVTQLTNALTSNPKGDLVPRINQQDKTKKTIKLPSVNIAEGDFGLEVSGDDDPVINAYERYFEQAKKSRIKLMAILQQNILNQQDIINDQIAGETGESRKRILEAKLRELELEAKITEQVTQQTFYQDDINKLQELTNQNLSKYIDEYQDLMEEVKRNAARDSNSLSRDSAQSLIDGAAEQFRVLSEVIKEPLARNNLNNVEVEKQNLDELIAKYEELSSSLYSFKSNLNDLQAVAPLNELQQERINRYLLEIQNLELILDKNRAIEVDLQTQILEFNRQQESLNQRSQELNARTTIRGLESDLMEGQASLFEGNFNSAKADEIRQINESLNRQIEFENKLFEIEQRRLEIQQLYINQPDRLTQENLNLDNQISLLEENFAIQERLQAQRIASDSLLGQLKTSIYENLTNTLTELINGTKSVTQAFKEMIQSILQEIIRAQIQKAIAGLIGGLFGGGFNSGGIVSPKGFNSGGLITDGSDLNKDSTLIYATKGEYVLPRSSVQALGVPFLNSLRNMGKGNIKGFNSGGMVGNISTVGNQQTQNQRFSFETVRIGERDYIESSQLSQFEQVINGRISESRKGASEDVFNSLLYDYSARQRLLGS